MNNRFWIFIYSAVILYSNSISAFSGEMETISESLRVYHGPINGAVLERNGKTLAVYGYPAMEPIPVDMVLFTHHRRDVVWAGRALVENGAKAVVPAKEISLFTSVHDFWNAFATKRFHDYAQQTTKILTAPLPIARTVNEDSNLEWEGIPIRVLDTPGYTRGAVSYLMKIDGKTIAFTGDLIYGDGKILDWYSLQDAIPEAKIRGYHGYAGRIGQLVESLRKVADCKPDLIIPARGPIIKNPQAAIERLIKRLEKAYENYLSINALRWYFGDDHILTCARRVMGPDAEIDWMPFAETLNERPPEWIIPISNTRLIVSEDKSGFLIDCGSQNIIKKVQELIKEGSVRSIEGIYITHYHDDHTDQAMAGSEIFGCPVYACSEQRDILECPSAYRLPAMTANPIHNLRVMPEGSILRWNEFTFTFSYHPGQTIYHGGLVVKKDGGETIFFIGDSFTPSGIDDYCLLNRNLLHPDMGYFYCLDVLKKMKPDYLLINEHVVPTFRFSQKQIDRMIATLNERVELLRELFPWDDPNYGIDEGWARFYPYGTAIKAGAQAEIGIRIMNHSNQEGTFSICPHIPKGWQAETKKLSLTLAPLAEGIAKMTVTAPQNAKPGQYILTADVSMGEWDLRDWIEGMITIGE